MAIRNGKPVIRQRLYRPPAAEPTTVLHKNWRRFLPMGSIRSFMVLLSRQYRRNSLLLWIIWITNSFSYYGLVLFTSDYFALIGSEDELLNSLITAGEDQKNGNRFTFVVQVLNCRAS